MSTEETVVKDGEKGEEKTDIGKEQEVPTQQESHLMEEGLHALETAKHSVEQDASLFEKEIERGISAVKEFIGLKGEADSEPLRFDPKDQETCNKSFDQLQHQDTTQLAKGPNGQTSPHAPSIQRA